MLQADNYGWVIHNGEFWHTIHLSAMLAIETIASASAVRPDRVLGAPEGAALRPVIAFCALIPFVVPPIVHGRRAAPHVRKGTPDGSTASPWGAFSSRRM